MSTLPHKLFDERRSGTAVEQLAGALTDAIKSGVLTPGQRLPSIRTLVADHGVSYHTAVSAYGRLASTGLISASQGRGFFVEAHRAMHRHHDLTCGGSEQDSQQLSAFRQLFHGDASTMKLGSGWLPPSWRDTDALARVIRRTASFARSTLVEYGDPMGHMPLREHLVQHLHFALGVVLHPSQILTTLGATQALDLVIRQLIEPGDVVLIDDPCNSSLVKLLALARSDVIGIPRESDGPNLGVLEEVLKTRKVKAFFVNSVYHNPTGSTLSPQNAFQVLQLAYQYDVVVVEDDVYGDFDGSNNGRLVTMDGLRKVVYVGSFSKTLSANLRVGYVVAPASLTSKLAAMKLLTSVAVPSFCERFISATFADGSYHGHLRVLRQKLRASQAVAQAAFHAWGWSVHHAPAGGMFLWVRHPAITDMDAFLARANQMGILLLPGALFTADGRSSPWLRINVSHLEVDRAAPLFDVQSDRHPHGRCGS
ncbi:PLP-dependent aminotransferase family protein [Burkholderia latens]|uniref:GntR family transcriptional regulator n=1 Tax=Burkholderia latens TaxID=488446 RepID=A0A6H9TK38_9BURK|nr:PLP-dependent aminotransferase family protein [Burkholderia latens]KAB0644178.1 PLP-dependent aminotransferase family protein [Burkholderia latens]VWB44255.1 GntR family transcriptional regulator [Burkholderia latens]